MAIAERTYLVAGPRVGLRLFTRADVDAWQDWPDYDEPTLVDTSPRRMSDEQRTRWLEDLRERQRQIPFAVDDEHGRMIGRLFLRNVRRDEGSAVLGIDFRQEVLGQGYGTEALRVFLDYYFERMGFRRMLLSVGAFNERAQRSYESVGFRSIGSHWDPFLGPDILNRRDQAAVHFAFRRSGGGLEALYYDMALDRADWLARQRDDGR